MQRRNYQNIKNTYSNYGNVYITEEEKEKKVMEKINSYNMPEEKKQETRPDNVSTFPVSNSVRNRQ